MTKSSWAELGFLRAGVAVPALVVGDPGANAAAIVETLERAAREDVSLVLFPELALTGYTCADLFYQSTLRAA